MGRTLDDESHLLFVCQSVQIEVVQFSDKRSQVVERRRAVLVGAFLKFDLLVPTKTGVHERVALRMHVSID